VSGRDGREFASRYRPLEEDHPAGSR